MRPTPRPHCIRVIHTGLGLSLRTCVCGSDAAAGHASDTKASGLATGRLDTPAWTHTHPPSPSSPGRPRMGGPAAPQPALQASDFSVVFPGTAPGAPGRPLRGGLDPVGAKPRRRGVVGAHSGLSRPFNNRRGNPQLREAFHLRGLLRDDHLILPIRRRLLCGPVGVDSLRYGS